MVRLMEAIVATTDRGSGLTLPLAKGISRLILVYNALGRNWPLTQEEAAQEIQEANQHFGGIIVDEHLLSESAIATLNEWRTSMTELGAELTASSRNTPEEQVVEATKALIRTRAGEAWSVLTLIDRELTGLTDAQTDPGRLP
jgi:hypothetical protein